jgi:hypothetical protein
MINSAFNHIRSIMDDESMDDDVRLIVIREVMSKYPRIPTEDF